MRPAVENSTTHGFLRAVLLCFIVGILLCCGLFAASCKREQPPLPVLGTFDRDFRLMDQENQEVTPATFLGKIYVTDFFFTTCPTICPLMKVEMMRLYEVFKDTPDLLLLSHTIDPEFDTVAVLKDYAHDLKINNTKWHMVTGSKQEIYDLAKQYMLGVVESEEAPGGFIHSGSFCLVDRKRQIRGYYNGTDAQAVDQLIQDIKRLLHE
jgi:protein SCO1/2